MSRRKQTPRGSASRWAPLKRGSVALVLALVAVWPLAHHLAWRRLAFDPWMFFGWAMYSTPNPTVLVTVAELDGNRADELTLDPATRERVRRWALQRSVRGRALRPDELALTIGEAFPEVRDLWIRVRTLRLDRSSARLVPDDETFSYRRGGTVD